MKHDVSTPGSTDTLYVVSDRIRFLGNVPGSGLDLLEVEVPVGAGTPPHSHVSPEMFYIVEGTLSVGLFGPGAPPVVTEAGPGAVVRIASGMPHNYTNAGTDPVRMMVLIEPSMVDFFRDIGTVEPQAEPDFARIGAAMARHGIEVLTMAA
jgi:quercetin dioxygenase-like cupin family protein